MEKLDFNQVSHWPRELRSKNSALDSICPSGWDTITVMKFEILDETKARGDEVIARFGKAALIKQPNGSWQLNGGSAEDRLSAREWISLFQHEAVVPCG
jgi:hypothetical protein